jgi:hypothetical protein
VGLRQEEEAEGGQTKHKLLENEPLLAARLVIENSMCLLLDVDDIDRICSQQYGIRESEEHNLRSVRAPTSVPTLFPSPNLALCF